MLQLRAGGAKSYIAGEGVSVSQPLGDALIFDFRDDFTVASFSFADDFNRADGAIGNGWNGATWTISGNKAINTPTLGSEALTDGGLEAWLSATDPTNWSEGLGGTSTVNREASVIHGGSFAARLDIDASTSIAQITQVVNSAVVGQWVRRSAWAKSNPVSKTATLATLNVFPTNEYSYTLTGTYAQIVETRRVIAANPQMSPKRAGGSASSSLYFDDASWKVLTLSTLFLTQNFNLNDVDATVKATLAAGNPAGLVLNLDSTSSPANFVLAYHDRTNAYLDKCVAGTYTNLITAAATYSAGAILRVSKSGNTYKLYYNGAQIGADQSVSDVGIVSNTIHGEFSTYEGNSLDDFSVSSPLPSPLIANPGPGQWTVTDVENAISIKNGLMRFAPQSATPVYGEERIVSGPFTRQAGRAIVERFNAVTSPGNSVYRGWATVNNPNSAMQHAIRIPSSGRIEYRPGGISPFDLGVALNGVDYQAANVLRSVGALVAVKGGAYTNWTLVWVDEANSNATMYAAISNYDQDISFDTVRILPLGAPFNTDFGLVTQRLAGVVAAGTTFVHEANFILEWVQTTLPSASGARVRFRVVDANNYWYAVSFNTATFELYEVVGGVATVRGSAAASAASGYRHVVVADGPVIRGYSNNVLRWTYNTATNFQTATTGELNSLGTGGVISDIASWPRVLPLAAAALLDEALAG